jgi:hypothetical protein
MKIGTLVRHKQTKTIHRVTGLKGNRRFELDHSIVDKVIDYTTIRSKYKYNQFTGHLTHKPTNALFRIAISDYCKAAGLKLEAIKDVWSHNEDSSEEYGKQLFIDGQDIRLYNLSYYGEVVVKNLPNDY